MLPEILSERSGGAIIDNGYDYIGSEPMLVIFLKTNEVQSALPCIVEVIEVVPICGCLLQRGAVIAVNDNSGWNVVYPAGINEMFDVS